MRKGVSPLLSGVLYVAIFLVGIGVVTQIAMPAIDKMKDSAAIDQSKLVLTKIDKALKEVVEEGEGSTRVVDINIKKGKIKIDADTDEIYYVLETETGSLSPRSQIQIGNLILSSSASVNASEDSNYIVLENEHLKCNFSKNGGTEDSFQSINISQIINSVYMKDTGSTLDGNNITLKLETMDSLGVGSGYVILKDSGSELGRGVVIAHVNNSWVDYDLYFTLESGADFLEIYLRNYNVH